MKKSLHKILALSLVTIVVLGIFDVGNHHVFGVANSYSNDSIYSSGWYEHREVDVFYFTPSTSFLEPFRTRGPIIVTAQVQREFDGDWVAIGDEILTIRHPFTGSLVFEIDARMLEGGDRLMVNYTEGCARVGFGCSITPDVKWYRVYPFMVYYVNFEENGGTYVPSQRVIKTSPITTITPDPYIGW